MARRKKSADPNRQYRHFVFSFTVHPVTGDDWADPADGGDADLTLCGQIESALRSLDACFGRSLSYRIAQLEKGSSAEQPSTDERQKTPEDEMSGNGLHLQGYVETSQSIRLRTLFRRLPYGWIRPRKGLRDTARDYATPSKGTDVEFDPTHIAGPWEFGRWRVSRADETADDTLQRATDLVVRGVSLRHVAERFPKTFVRYGRGLRDLHDTLFDARPVPERMDDVMLPSELGWLDPDVRRNRR